MVKSTITCSCCGKEKASTENYYSSQSYIHKSTGRLNICKECIWDYVIDNKGNTDVVKMKDILQMIDKPYDSFILESSEEEAKKTNKNIFKIYMKNLGLRQNRHLRWSDSDMAHNSVSDKTSTTMSNTLTNNLVISDDEKEELFKFWGKGFDLESYLWLQNEYEDFVNRYECDSKGMELLIKQICLTQLDIQNGRANNQKVDPQLKTLQDLLGSSNLKPVQETGANAVEQETFGTLLKKYENEKPVPEADPRWKDVDGISKYVKVFFLGHLTRMLGIKNDYADEYWEEIDKYTVAEPVVDSEDGVEDDIS